MVDELRPLVTQDQQLVDFCGRDGGGREEGALLH